MRNNKQKNNQGFTLIELMVVIAIIGLLSSVVLTFLSGARSKARDTKRVAEMRSVEKALNLYALDHNGNLPISTYYSFSTLPTINGHVACDAPGVIANNNNLYDTLVPKYLSARPANDPQFSQGYCYLYLTDSTVVGGVSYDQNGKLISTGPLAGVISQNVRSAVFANFLENTKTFSGYQALVGISYGPNPPVMLNMNYTTGIKNDVNITFGNQSGY